METLQKTSTCHGQAVIQHPLVSVVMPAYNAEKYIGEATVRYNCRHMPIGSCWLLMIAPQTIPLMLFKPL